MKRTTMVFAAYLCVICGGVFSISYWESLQVTHKEIARPEGYQTPTRNDRVSPTTTLRLKREGRVTKLEIAPNVPKYFDEKLEMVAFAPGSGWLKFKTGDGITPTLQFKRVTRGDVQRFNAFSKSIDSPIRVALAGNVLHVTAEETAADLAYFKGKKTTSTRAMAFNEKFNQADTAPRVVMRKDKDGNVFLVKAKEKKKTTAEAVASSE